MKKVFLYAYDRRNLGDDLFVHTIVKRYPHVRFYMWTDRQNRETFRCLPNLKIVDKDGPMVRFLHRLRPSWVARYKAWLEKRCEAVVYIGGSIFMEYPNWKQILTWWEHEAENRPFYALGCNFGPYQTEAYREKLAEIFGRMKDVCFRDAYSKNLFQGVPTIRQAPDILLGYAMPRVPVKEKQIFVSVIDCAERDSCDDRAYTENMSALLKGCLEDGCRLVLASFCAAEGDETGVRKLLSAMDAEKDPRVQVLAYDGTNVEVMTRAIAESDYVIASRFHGTILALAAGRPVLPVIYSSKTKHVLEDLGFEGVTIDLRRPGAWDFDQSRKNWDKPAKLLSGWLREAAQQHFAKLDEELR